MGDRQIHTHRMHILKILKNATDRQIASIHCELKRLGDVFGLEICNYKWK